MYYKVQYFAIYESNTYHVLLKCTNHCEGFIIAYFRNTQLIKKTMKNIFIGSTNKSLVLIAIIICSQKLREYSVPNHELNCQSRNQYFLGKTYVYIATGWPGKRCFYKKIIQLLGTIHDFGCFIHLKYEYTFKKKLILIDLFRSSMEI